MVSPTGDYFLETKCQDCTTTLLTSSLAVSSKGLDAGAVVTSGGPGIELGNTSYPSPAPYRRSGP